MKLSSGANATRSASRPGAILPLPPGPAMTATAPYLGMDQAMQAYIDGIAPEHRPLFDRLHRLILAAHPDAAVVLSYQIPTYKVGGRRLYLAAWKHGVSIPPSPPAPHPAFLPPPPPPHTSHA